jgi:hypothetical protein
MLKSRQYNAAGLYLLAKPDQNKSIPVLVWIIAIDIRITLSMVYPCRPTEVDQTREDRPTTSAAAGTCPV